MNKSGLTVCSVVLLSTFLSACGGGGSTAASNTGDGGGDIGNGAGATTSPALASGVAAAHAKLTARPEALEFRAVNTAWVKCAALPQEVTLSYETPKNGSFVLFDDGKDGKELCYLAFRETPETVNIAVKNADGTDFPGSGSVLLDVSDTFNTSPDPVNPEPPPAPVNHAPTANAGTDQQANETASISLSGSGTDPDGDTLTYSWTQTDSSPPVPLTGATTATPSFTTPAVNADTTLSFTLTVSDGHGGTATDTVNVLVKNVPNVPPTANAGADQPVNEQVLVNLAGSGTDTDGSIASYVWTQTAGDAVTLTGENTATPSFTAPTVSNADASKTLTFKLVVTDNEGATGEASVTITVNAVNENPTANAGADQQANEGALVKLSGSGTDVDGDALTYSWSQVGTPVVTLTGADTATLSFVAPLVFVNTTLTFTLTVDDGHGGTETGTVNITITNPPASVNAYPTAPDRYEGATGDNSFEDAKPIVLGELQYRTLFPGGDVDFVSVELAAGVTYEFSTNNLCDGCDTVLVLYDEARNKLSYNDDYMYLDSHLLYTPTVAGIYYIEVANYSSRVSAKASYTLGVREFVNGDGDSFSSFYDCNDGDSSIYPYAPEIAGDGIDQSCKGVDRLASNTPDTAEDDDSFATAKPLSYITGESWEITYRSQDTYISNSRTIDTPNDDDYFSVVVPAYTSVYIGLMENTVSGLTSTVYDQAQTEIGGASDGGHDFSNPAATSQTYYVKFSATNTGWYVPYIYNYGADQDGDGVSSVQGDCNDTDAAVNPYASEQTGDGIDSNCDGHDGIPPSAVAGANQVVNAGSLVMLDGSQSIDPDGSIVAYHWTQSWRNNAGVILSGSNNALATFTAPDVSGSTDFIFRLSVADNDGIMNSSNFVTVTVNPVTTAAVGIRQFGSVSTFNTNSVAMDNACARSDCKKACPGGKDIHPKLPYCL